MSAFARQPKREHAEAVGALLISEEEARLRLREAVRIYVTGALRAAAKEQMRLNPDGGNLDCEDRQTSGVSDDCGVFGGGGEL